MKRHWIIDNGETIWIDLGSNTIFMPYNRDPDTYSKVVKKLIKSGYVVQLEIVQIKNKEK